MYSSGFIGYCAGGTVKNLTIAGATVTGSHYVGVIAGYLELKAQINSCKVTSSETTNTTITAEHINDAQCGDKVGGICGYINATCKIDSCTVEKTTIKAGRDAGTIVGCAGSTESGYTAAKITSCSVDETTVSVTEISDTEAGHCTDNSHGQNIGGQIGRDLRNS